MFTVSRKWIMENKTPRGAWTRKQLAQIGVSWPPRAGWVRRCEGRQISEQHARNFEAFAKLGKPLKNNDEFNEPLLSVMMGERIL